MQLTSDQKLQIVLAGAHTSLDMNGITNYEDIPLGPKMDPQGIVFPQPGSLNWASNGVTAVDICGAPAVGFVRRVQSILIDNLDTGTDVASFQTYSISGAAVLKVIWKWSIATLYQVQYTFSGGWKMFTSAGVTE